MSLRKKVHKIEKLTHIWTSDEHVSKRGVEDAVFLVVDGCIAAEAHPERFGSPEPQSNVWLGHSPGDLTLLTRLRDQEISTWLLV